MSCRRHIAALHHDNSPASPARSRVLRRQGRSISVHHARKVTFSGLDCPSGNPVRGSRLQLDRAELRLQDTSAPPELVIAHAAELLRDGIIKILPPP